MRIGILENEDRAHTSRIDAAALSINRTMEFFPEFEETSEFYELRGARALHTALNCLGNVCCTGCNLLEGSASLRRGGGKLANQLAKEVLAGMAKEGARKEYLWRVEWDRDRHRPAAPAGGRWWREGRGLGHCAGIGRLGDKTNVYAQQ
jgi:hypothetical protein